ncbi:MAG: ROK family protein, partial [Lachnospiraceae bacterium]|nr:ROK family protein [Lachnospiraceae bacterium]
PEELKKRIPEIKDVPFYFLHDIEAFALGAYFKGESRGQGKTMFVCIGTGTGTAFVKDGKVLKDCEDNAPLNGWIYDDPFKDGKVDEYLSVRGLARKAEQVMGRKMSGLQLFEMCEAGDENALKTYRLFGEDVKEALSRYITDFRPDNLVLGGQISKSFGYFGAGLRDFCGSMNIKIELIRNTSIMSMLGLLEKIRRSENA